MTRPIDTVVQQRHRLLREGLRMLLDAEPGVNVVGVAVSPFELDRLCTHVAVAVTVFTADDPNDDAIGTARRVLAHRPDMHLVGLASHSTPAVTRLHRGGVEIVYRRDGFSAVVDAIRAAAARQEQLHIGTTPRSSNALSNRELQVLGLIATGCSTADVAEHLRISRKTVESHKQRVFTKLGVQNQAHAVAVAMERGLIRPDAVLGDRVSA